MALGELRAIPSRLTPNNLYQCRSDQAKSTMENSLSTLRTRLKKHKTVPMITELLVLLLKEYRMGYEMRPTFTAYCSDQIQSLARSVYQKQRQLGPRNLAKGFLIQEWECLQNVCENNRSTNISNIEWASRVISALWGFSKSIRDERCSKARDPNTNGQRSLKNKKLMRILDQEVEVLHQTRLEYDSQQLLHNIACKKDKAQNHIIYKWLSILRHRKEEEQRRKQHDQTNRIRTQPITNLCERG